MDNLTPEEIGFSMPELFGIANYVAEQKRLAYRAGIEAAAKSAEEWVSGLGDEIAARIRALPDPEQKAE